MTTLPRIRHHFLSSEYRPSRLRLNELKSADSVRVKPVLIWVYRRFYRDLHDHRPGHRPAAPQPSGTRRTRPRGGRDRRFSSPRRDGREHPPGLRLCLAAVPGVGQGRWPRSSAGHHAGRGPLYGPPGGHRPVHRQRSAGSLGHLPLPRRGRHAEGRQPSPTPGGGRGHQGLAQPGPGTQAGRCPHLGRLARVREVLWLARRGRGANGIRRDRPQACRPEPGHHRGPRRWWAQALRGGPINLGRRGAVGRSLWASYDPEG